MMGGVQKGNALTPQYYFQTHYQCQLPPKEILRMLKWNCVPRSRGPGKFAQFLVASCLLSTGSAFVLSPESSFISVLRSHREGSTVEQRSLQSEIDDNTNSNRIQDNDAQTQRHLRFSGVGRLYEKNQESSENSGDDDVTIENHLAIVDKLTKATVAVIGLGGVGSWAAEALCRSGIGNLILIDLDDICISNTNRQLHAMSSTVGQLKIEEMKRRLLDINPQCNITNILDFVSEDNVKDVLESLRPELTVCLDAIDGQYEKTALIAACAEGGIPIVTCGGAAGRSDPTKIVCDDITRSVEDRLLFWCRKNLRQKFGFTKGVANIKIKPKRWGISTVFSTEVLRPISQTSNGSPSSSLRTCDGPMGTACFVTGTYGFVAASRVVEMIANDDITVPNLKRMKHN